MGIDLAIIARRNAINCGENPRQGRTSRHSNVQTPPKSGLRFGGVTKSATYCFGSEVGSLWRTLAACRCACCNMGGCHAPGGRGGCAYSHCELVLRTVSIAVQQLGATMIVLWSNLFLSCHSGRYFCVYGMVDGIGTRLRTGYGDTQASSTILVVKVYHVVRFPFVCTPFCLGTVLRVGSCGAVMLCACVCVRLRSTMNESVKFVFA